LKRDRVAEIHFYEWRIGAWATSETRDRLDAAGRGIYRELLDQCYGQGKIPDDPEWICRRCACTQEQYEKAWRVISRHFPKITDTEYRYNVLADLVRKEYFQYVGTQRANRKSRIDKPKQNNDLDDGGTTIVQPSFNGGSTNGNGNGNGNTTATQDNTTATATEITLPMQHEYPETLKVLREHDAAADAFFCVRIAEAVARGIAGDEKASQWPPDKQQMALSDRVLAKCCRESFATPRKQPHGTGLLLSTVPKIVLGGKTNYA
jgi:hypothetical protein